MLHNRFMEAYGTMANGWAGCVRGYLVGVVLHAQTVLEQSGFPFGRGNDVRL